MGLSVLIVEDEPLARRTLRGLLRGAAWVGPVHEAADGDSAFRAMDRIRPDLLFLDVELPGRSGLSVLEARHRPRFVVFTTAYDRYAVTAFELEAFDYLLKPFAARRFGRVMERVNRVLRAPAAAPVAPRVDRAPPERLFAKLGRRTIVVPLDQVERLEGWDDHVALFVDGKRMLVTHRLRDLAGQLDAHRFVRIHRSHIVNLDHVTDFTAAGDRMCAVMKRGDRIPASRAGAVALRRLFRSPSPPARE